jgi:GntR family transcriptional regulator/MocR family aminotransferase
VGSATRAELDEAKWLQLEPGRGETLRAALERTLRDAIRSGALREGVRLPPSRALAAALGVSRGVVTDAYEQLEAQGFLIVRPRRGTVVAAVARPRHAPAKVQPAAFHARYDLAPTTPDVTLFPLRRWLDAFHKAALRDGPSRLGYRPPAGEPILRTALADHLGRTRGVIADPEQILVVQGTAQGVSLLLQVFRRRQFSTVAVEDPSHTSQHERIREAGFDLVAQRVDASGIVVGGLDADAVIVTPAHQFPTGVVLSGDRRRHLLEWARTRGAFVVEDDYDAEFRYDRAPVRALQGLDPDHMIQLGTLSKTLAPAVRLGWIVLPLDLVDEAEHAKRLLDDFSPALDQIALAELLRSGNYDRHVRRARIIYRARRDRLLKELAKQLPECDVEGVAAGIHVLLLLPEGISDVQVTEAARAVGVVVAPLSGFRLTPASVSGLVVGYGRLHESAIRPAVSALAGAIRPFL